MIAIAFLIPSILPILAVDTSSDSQPAKTQTVATNSGMTILSQYGYDEALPNYYGQINKVRPDSFIKCFKNVVIPGPCDAIISWFSETNNDGYGLSANFTVSNGNNTYAPSGSYLYYVYDIKADDYQYCWHYLRLYNVQNKLSSGTVLVNYTALTSSAYGKAFFAINLATPTNQAKYNYWEHTASGWVNDSAYTYCMRLEIISQNSPVDARAGSQLQMASELTFTDWPYGSDAVYSFSPHQLIDGLSSSGGNGGAYTGLGATTSDRHTEYYYNFSFKNRVILSIGDSIMMGHPHHNYNPATYGVADEPKTTFQWQLELLLHQEIVLGRAFLLSSDMLNGFNDYIMAYHPDMVFIEGGINDILNGGYSAAQIEANLAEMYSRANDNGTTVIAWTILPCANGYLDGTKETKRLAVNTWIKAQASDDIKVMDMDAIVGGSGDSTLLNTSYDNGDGIHVNLACYRHIANLTFASIFSSTVAPSTTYEITKVIFETGTAFAGGWGRPQMVNLSFNGGYRYESLTNTSHTELNTSPIISSWLKIGVISLWRMNNTIPTNFPIGEIRILGVPVNYTTHAVFGGSVYNNITSTSDRYGKIPYPRNASPLMQVGLSASYCNVTDVTRGSTVEWTAISTGSNPIIFSFPGLGAGIYKLYVDGNWVRNIVSTGSTVSFVYSEPWSEHDFELLPTSITGSITSMVNLIFIMLAVGMVCGVMGESVRMLRKEQVPKVDTLINMVIYIVVGLAILGAAYMTVI